MNERNAFLEWRRKLVDVEENQQLLLTPYEKNLQVWRQLWRVVERSDVVVQVWGFSLFFFFFFFFFLPPFFSFSSSPHLPSFSPQIVDARNPLLFRSTDLESYITEVDSNKKKVSSSLLLSPFSLFLQKPNFSPSPSPPFSPSLP